MIYTIACIIDRWSVVYKYFTVQMIGPVEFLARSIRRIRHKGIGFRIGFFPSSQQHVNVRSSNYFSHIPIGVSD